jgi:hypothetical protein
MRRAKTRRNIHSQKYLWLMMVDTPIPISDISDPEQIRVKLLASGKEVHAPMSAVASAAIHGMAAKTTPVDADEFPLADSAASFAAKKVTWANIKATLKTYFDTLYQPLASTLTSWAAITRASGFDTFVATPSSANLRSLLTDETGTGAAVFAGAPTITGVAVFSGIPSMTGGALTFPATQVASSGANDLDDYEEGTFTPAFSATGATFAYGTQAGVYTKTGRDVSIDMTISLAAAGNTLSANALSITGLPFTAGGTAGVFPVRWFGTTGTFVLILARTSGATLLIEGLAAAATASAGVTACNQLLHATNQSTFRITGTYPV